MYGERAEAEAERRERIWEKAQQAAAVEWRLARNVAGEPQELGCGLGAPHTRIPTSYAQVVDKRTFQA